MKEFKVELKLIMTYNGESKNEVFKMIDEEFGLRDKQFELDIDGESVYDYEDDALSESNENQSHPSVKRNKIEARDDASPTQDVNQKGDEQNE